MASQISAVNRQRLAKALGLRMGHLVAVIHSQGEETWFSGRFPSLAPGLLRATYSHALDAGVMS